MGRLHAHVRPHVRPHPRSSLEGPYGAGGVHDGISFNAANGRVVIKAAGSAPTVTTLTSAFTFTGGNQSLYRGPSGFLTQSVTNTPRIEYGPGGDVYGLLMEASRTNLCLQSQDLATTWVPGSATISTNQTAAPDGTTTADKLVSSAGTAAMFVGQAFTLSATTVYNFSVFAKYISGEAQFIAFRPDVDGAPIVSFDILNGLVMTTTAAWAGSTITPYANGWYRISARYTTVGTAYTFRISLDNTGNAGSYTGDGTKGAYLWGAQLELGAFPSSYIPTTTVSVARTADNCIRTLASEFSATAGTVFVDVADFISSDVTANNAIASFDDNTANNRLTLQRTNTAGAMRLNVFTAGANQAGIDGFSAISTARAKLAAAWTANDFAISGNGGAVVPDAAGTIPTVTQLSLGVRLGGEQLYGHIRTFDYYPTRLGNEVLQQRSA